MVTAKEHDAGYLKSVKAGSCPNAESAFPLNENAPHLEGNQGKGLKSLKASSELASCRGKNEY